MNYYGYNRVSSADQHENRGNTSIKTFCETHGYKLERIYVDKQSGRDFDRIRYKVLKEDVLRPGDVLIVPEFDRLGRAEQTKKELEYFKENDIRVIFLDIPTTQMDFSAIENSMARMILGCINDMLISFYDCISRAEIERKRKRQREGYVELKKRGEWDKLGRPRRMSLQDFKVEYQQYIVNGRMKNSELMKQLGLSENTYFRYVRELKQELEEN